MASFDELLSAANAYKSETLDVNATKSSNPDESAKIYNLAREKNIEPKLAELQYDKLVKPDTRKLSKPVQDFLLDPQRSAIAIDDTDNLEWWERGLKEIVNVGKIGYSSLYTFSGGIASTVGSTFDLAGDVVSIPFKPFVDQDAIDENNPLKFAGDYVGDVASNQFAHSRANLPTDTVIPEPVVSGVHSFFTNTSALLAGLATRNPNVPLSIMGSQTYGASYNRAKEQGFTNEDAFMYAANQAIAEVVTERIPVLNLLEDVGANSSFAKTIIRQMAAEIPGEQAATVWQDMVDWATFNPDKTLSEFVEERADAAANTLISTIVSTGLQTSAVSAVDYAFRDKKAVDKIQEKVTESKLHQRSPELFQEYLQTITQDTDIENIYIDAEKLNLSTLQQDAAYDLIKEQYTEAKQVGGDIVIPFDKFASVVATSPNLESLKDFVRVNPDQGTAQPVGDLLKEAESNIEIQREAKRIHDDVTQQLINTGRLDPKSAKISASIIPAYVTTKAIRSGMSVQDVYKTMGLEIVGPTSDRTISNIDDPKLILEQSAYHGSPHKFDKFSLEAIGTGEGAQAYGWGLYFSGEKSVAEFYQQSTQQNIELKPGKYIKKIREEFDVPEGDLKAEARRLLDRELGGDKDILSRFADEESFLGLIASALKAGEFVRDKGNIYQADIPEDSDLIEWDKPLKEQSDTIKKGLEKTLLDLGQKDYLNAIKSFEAGDSKALKNAGFNIFDYSGLAGQIVAHINNNSANPKAGAKALNANGIFGTKYLDQFSRDDDGDNTYNYVIWDDAKVTIEAVNDELVQARELLQGDNQGPRGTISILPNTLIVKLSESSNLSTFLHESAHAFLEMEGKFHANAKDKTDGDKILKWLGADSFESITRDQHEKWARGFEKYLGEGKAPSVELQSVFRRFASWLKQIYRNLTNLDVELTDDIREVMDRMLATDEAIDRMKGRFKPLFDNAEDAGATDAEYKAYSERSTPDTAKEDLRTKLLKQLERQHKKWWRDESAPIAKKIRAELLETPIYQAVETIKSGEFKLNRDEVKEVLVVSKLPAKFNKLTSKDGRSIDEIAAAFGVASGYDLVNQIKDKPTLKQAVDEKTHQEMVSRHGDALSDGTLQEMAEQAARNPEHAKKLSSEIAFLSRKANVPAIDRDSLKAYAAERIANLPYKKIYPNRYRAAEVRAARSAAVSKNNGDLEQALKYKQQELTNFYLAKEAQIAKDKALKIRASLKAIQTRKYDSKKYDNDIVNQAKVLIAAYDFRKNSKEASELASARISSVKNWIESQSVNPETVTSYVQAEILGKTIPYDQMRTEDLVALNDVVKSLMFGAKEAKAEDSQEYKRNIESGKEWLKENRIDHYETEIDNDNPWLKVKSTIQDLFASLRKMESLVRQADGMKEQGWLWKQTIKPLLDAANTALSMRTESHKKLNEIFKGHEGAFNGLKDRREFTLSSGKKITLSYGARLSIALNMGNDDNFQALVNQGKITPDDTPYLSDKDITTIVSTLTEKDWDLVQSVWDYVDTFWPDISALEVKRSGAAPQKVKPRSFVTPNGKTMKGGYYPLVGDPIGDFKQQDQDITTDANNLREGGAAKKSTKHGSTIERVGFGGKKIDLSIDVLFNHIDGVIHDITHWEAVRDVDRVLRNPKIYTELGRSLGNAGARAVKDRLTEVAAGPQRINGLRGWSRFFRHARIAATYNALGYSVRTAIMNTAGITTAIADMDAKTVASGAAEYYSNKKKSDEFILSKSKYMTDRGQVINRDIATIRNNIKGDTRWNSFKDHAFWLMTQTDKAIVRPIWIAAYRKGEGMFDTEQEAIDYADRMVARTQGSGLDLDLANVETRNELMKSLTVMYSAMSAIYNITTEQVKRYKSGQINVVELTAKMSWLLVVPAIFEMLLKGDEEEPLESIPSETAFYALGLLPVGRDAASSIKYGSVFPPPAVGLVLAPLELGKQAYQGELDKGLLRATTDTLSWGLLPGGAQFNRTTGYLMDLNEGEIDDFSIYSLLVTGKERK